jgi:hypothetical protein
MALFLFSSIAVKAQVNNPTLIFVTTAPTGSCTVPTPLQSVISTGGLYSCQAGTWAQIGSGGGGAPTICASGTYACLNDSSPQGFTGATTSPNAQGALLADSFSGADIGAKINTAGIALPVDRYGQNVGVIRLSGGSNSAYFFSTTIQLNNLTTTLDCQGATLVYTGSTVAIVVAGPLRVGAAGGGLGLVSPGIENCNLFTSNIYPPTGATTFLNYVPSIATIAVDAGGTGYDVGDTVYVQQGNGADGRATVATVSGETVTGLTETVGGYGYTAATGLATTTSGSGTGLTVNITVNAQTSCYPFTASPIAPTGIFMGGDPTGNIAGNPSTNFGYFQDLYNVKIGGFCAGVTFGDNTWSNHITNSLVEFNYYGILDSSDDEIVNTGERNGIVGTIFDNNVIGLENDNGSEFSILASSFDFQGGHNTTGAIRGGTAIVGSDMDVDLETDHIEQDFAPVIAEFGAFRGDVNITDGDIRVASTTPATEPSLFNIAGSDGQFTIRGTAFNLEHVITSYFTNPTAGAVFRVKEPILGTEGALPTTISTEPNQFTFGGSTTEIYGNTQGVCWNGDIGIFRVSANVVTFSTNCNPGEANDSGFVSMNVLSLNDNISAVHAVGTAGNFGVPIVVASPARLTSQTPSNTTTPLPCPSGICPAGLYRIHFFAEVITTSTSGGTLNVGCGYTSASGQAQSVTPINQNTGTNTGISLATFTAPLAAQCDLFTSGAANITYSTTVGGTIVGSPLYDLSVYMERLQ